MCCWDSWLKDTLKTLLRHYVWLNYTVSAEQHCLQQYPYKLPLCSLLWESLEHCIYMLLSVLEGSSIIMRVQLSSHGVWCRHDYRHSAEGSYNFIYLYIIDNCFIYSTAEHTYFHFKDILLWFLYGDSKISVSKYNYNFFPIQTVIFLLVGGFFRHMCLVVITCQRSCASV